MKIFHCRLCEMQWDAKFLNVVQLGVGFMFIFTAFQSCGNIQEYVIQSVSASRNGTSKSQIDPHAGYNSLAIIYGVLTVFNFLAPPVVNKLGQKWSMVIGGVTYLLFLLSFLDLSDAFFYTSSAILGFGAALIWVGQGSYLTQNSDDETVSRNSGIFWALLQSSLPIGGIFLYTQLRTDPTDVTLSISTINVIYICFSVLAAVGTIILALLRKTPLAKTPEGESPIIAADEDSPNVDSVVGSTSTLEASPRQENTILTTFTRMLKILITWPMLLLAVVFVFTGLELTFWSGVYSTSIANTLSFTTPSKELLALNTIFVGVGEILGGGIFGLFGKKFNKFGRNPTIFLAMFVHMVVFFLIYLNIPGKAPIEPTHDMSYLKPNQYLALFCSFLVGFGDACWNTQIYSLLGSFYADDSAPAFGLFKFFQSFAACAGFFFSGSLLLQWQLLILGLLCPVAALAFFKVEWKAQAVAFHHEKHP